MACSSNSSGIRRAGGTLSKWQKCLCHSWIEAYVNPRARRVMQARHRQHEEVRSRRRCIRSRNSLRKTRRGRQRSVKLRVSPMCYAMIRAVTILIIPVHQLQLHRRRHRLYRMPQCNVESSGRQHRRWRKPRARLGKQAHPCRMSSSGRRCVHS